MPMNKSALSRFRPSTSRSIVFFSVFFFTPFVSVRKYLNLMNSLRYLMKRMVKDVCPFYDWQPEKKFYDRYVRLGLLFHSYQCVPFKNENYLLGYRTRRTTMAQLRRKPAWMATSLRQSLCLVCRQPECRVLELHERVPDLRSMTCRICHQIWKLFTRKGRLCNA